MAVVNGTVVGDRDLSDLADRLKALSDPVRLRIYMTIAAAPDPVCVCELGSLGVSQPTVSHHLKKLRGAGLISGERRGTWVYYGAEPGAPAPAELLALMS